MNGYYRAYSHGLVSPKLATLELAVQWTDPRFGGVIVHYDADGRAAS